MSARRYPLQTPRTRRKPKWGFDLASGPDLSVITIMEKAREDVAKISGVYYMTTGDKDAMQMDNSMRRYVIFETEALQRYRRAAWDAFMDRIINGRIELR